MNTLIVAPCTNKVHRIHTKLHLLRDTTNKTTNSHNFALNSGIGVQMYHWQTHNTMACIDTGMDNCQSDWHLASLFGTLAYLFGTLASNIANGSMLLVSVLTLAYPEDQITPPPPQLPCLFVQKKTLQSCSHTSRSKSETPVTHFNTRTNNRCNHGATDSACRWLAKNSRAATTAWNLSLVWFGLVWVIDMAFAWGSNENLRCKRGLKSRS